MTNDEWLNDRVAHIKGLKAKSQQQELLVLLAEKPNRDASDDKKLNAIIRAEKAADRAAKARLAATTMIRAEHRAEQEAIRKARTNELCESAGLMGMAGLVDTKTGKPTLDRAELLGALLGLATVADDDSRRSQWRQAGAALLASKAKAEKA